MKRLIAISGGALLLSAFASCEPYLSLDEAVTGKRCGEEGCPDGFFCNAEMKCQPNGTIETGSAPVRPAPGAEGGAAGAAGAAPEGSAGAEGGSAEGSAGAGSEPMEAAGAGGAPGGGGAGGMEPGGNAGGSDSGEPGTGADAGCTPVELFRDLDGDGFGSEASGVIQDCPPVDGYVEDNTDCHDAPHTTQNPARDVFPGQPLFFTEGYPTANGESFDYDCSGEEEADPGEAFVAAPSNCEERDGRACGGDRGYVPPANARSGDGVEPLCGARQIRACGAISLTACTLIDLPAGPAFPCR